MSFGHVQKCSNGIYKNLTQTEQTAHNKSVLLVMFSPALHFKTHKGRMVELIITVFIVTNDYLSSLCSFNKVGSCPV